MSEEDKNFEFEKDLKNFVIFKEYCEKNNLSFFSDDAHTKWQRQHKINEILEDGDNN